MTKGEARVGKLDRPINRALLSIATALALGSAASTVLQLLVERAEQGTIEERVENLSASLKSTAQIITQIEQEVTSRQELVEKLKRDAQTARQLAKLNREEAEAVAQAIRGEIERSDERRFWWNVAQGLGLVLFGALISESIHWWRTRRRRSTS